MAGAATERTLVGLMLRQSNTLLSIRANRPGLHEITREVAAFVANESIGEGLLTIFCQHTSASLLIQENAAASARADLERYFQNIAPESASYEHDDEGPDDMPGHLRSALTHTGLSIPITDHLLALGTWQGVFLFEHRNDTPERKIMLHVIGE